ncbi:hypothetical protein LTR37_017402 [Vermiconidia calcicola]|uniref:Uncharacterized protein n=1 Tax=Vermiconidia calcicola TaxID=1690605 RepID=A0ACC3MK64_9PEZI|nr:hypothetical protein LTR37_017402 [Vermiconidia calcicola]
MAETRTLTAPATLSQPSRKGKKAWRKNVDLSEVQQGLETTRDEIIKTGGVIAERDSNDLFATDTTGDAEVARQQQGKKLLKADEIIALRSAVPGLVGRKRKAPESAVPVGSSKRAKNGSFVSHKELQRLKAVADGANSGLAVAEHAVTHDPWAENSATERRDARFDFLDEAKAKKEPKTLKQAPITLAANGKYIPSVRKPDAGKSYNPLVGDWSALLEREGATAVENEKARLAAEADATEREARAAEEAAKVDAAEKDEYATDYDSAWESEWDGFQSDAVEDVWTQKPKARKTVAERNKLKARKERGAKEVQERKRREREAEEKRIAVIAKEVSARDRARMAHLQSLPTNLHAGTLDSDADSDVEGEVQLQRRRFGKLPVPPAPLEVVLPDELEDSLRRLKPEGNLMQERYRNLLVSGKVEVRKRQGQKKQSKKTKSEKWSYKDWKLK